MSTATVRHQCAFLQSDMFAHAVLDQTGLGQAHYSGTLKYELDETQLLKDGLKAPPTNDTDEGAPPLITALAQDFGLRLESGKIPVEVIVVDSVTNPTPD